MRRGRRFQNGSSGHYGLIHTGAFRSRRLAASLILLPVLIARKLFTFVVTLNTVGLVFAASGHFSYAERWTSAMALGNLNVAILVRNELFGRFLYWFVNACFAKVSLAMSSLRLVLTVMDQWTPLWWRLGCTSVLQVIPCSRRVCDRTSRRHLSISEAFTAVVRYLALAGSPSRSRTTSGTIKSTLT